MSFSDNCIIYKIVDNPTEVMTIISTPDYLFSNFVTSLLIILYQT